MTDNEKIYQSILSRLSLVPIDALGEIDDFLRNFNKNSPHDDERRKEILSYAGSWNTMSDDDFNDFLSEAKRSTATIFTKEIEF